MNKSNVLAIGVILLALGLYLQMMYSNREGSFRNTIEDLGIKDNFVYITTILFWAGLIVVIASIAIRSKRRIVVPVETVEETPRGRAEEITYKSEEVVEKGEEESEQVYEEYSQTPEEAVEETMEEEVIEEEKRPGKVGEVIGFCPRCGAPVTEGVRYCRRCGLKLK